MFDYHKPVTLRDFVVGKARSGTLWVKRYTKVEQAYSDFPIWEFQLETLGM